MNHLVKHTRLLCISSKITTNCVTLQSNSAFFFLERSLPSANVFIEHISRRFFSSKKDVFKAELPRETDKKEPKYRGKTEDYKNKIYLKDTSDRMLGLKTKDEARLIAKHQRLILVEDLTTTKKIPTFKLTNPRDIDEIGDLDLEQVDNPSSSSSSEGVTSDSESQHSEAEDSGQQSTKSSKHPRSSLKHIMFTSKVSSHDLQVKINQAKRWLAKGHETLVKVNATGPDESTKLKMIDKEFDVVFNQPTKHGCKIMQHRITQKEVKFNVVLVDAKLFARTLGGEHHTAGEVIIDLDKVNPNELLNDENIIEKITHKDESSTSSSSTEQKGSPKNHSKSH